MGSKDRLGKASEAARAAQQNPYLQRLLEDEDLRSNLVAAYGAARSAYGRMTNGKPATQALLEDEKLQQELGRAIGSLRDATSALREAPASPIRPARRRGGLGRTLLVLGVGALLAIALNEGLRSKLLDVMFGAEEEFDYSSTTAPATPEPAGVAGA
jgi:ferric-dicitrate binding protein FerR (iron transport regulator)